MFVGLSSLSLKVTLMPPTWSKISSYTKIVSFMFLSCFENYITLIVLCFGNFICSVIIIIILLFFSFHLVSEGNSICQFNEDSGSPVYKVV